MEGIIEVTGLPPLNPFRRLIVSYRLNMKLNKWLKKISTKRKKKLADARAKYLLEHPIDEEKKKARGKAYKEKLYARL